MIKFLIKHLLPRVYEEIGQEYHANKLSQSFNEKFMTNVVNSRRRELTKTRNLKKVSN